MKTITDTITLALPAAAFPMDPERILFFDIETTGFSPVKNRIIEIGAVKVVDGVPYTLPVQTNIRSHNGSPTHLPVSRKC